MEYPLFPKIEFFVLDEFYKLSSRRDEERSDVINNSFNLLVNKYDAKFYLLGPNIDGISKGFAEKYNAVFYKTDYSLVDKRTIDLFSEEYGERGAKKLKKENALFDLLFKLKEEQTMIYCSSPERVEYLSRQFCKYLDEKQMDFSGEGIDLIEWIKENVGAEWGLIRCLNHKIGIHDGALQKHITSSIIDYFNKKKLNYLFCTTSIIEGVNTSAKNIVFFDKRKGVRKLIDYFDYNNIKGRSGRMMIHYVGRIFNFNKPPEKESVIVDIPFFEQNNVSDEVLIHISDKDIRDKLSQQYKNLQKIPKVERELFKKNGVLVKGQKVILNQIKNEIQEKHALLNWSGMPLYHQLEYVLSLAWNNLIKEGETVKPMTLNKLIKVTFDYGFSQDISKLVNKNVTFFKSLEQYSEKPDEEIFDHAVIDAFQIMRHWFHYKIPKWLNVINNLQSYVCEKNGLPAGNYNFYSNRIENDFVRENLSILLEYGIPKSAIDKLKTEIPSSLNEDSVLDTIREKKLFQLPALIKYEKDKIIENL